MREIALDLGRRCRRVDDIVCEHDATAAHSRPHGVEFPNVEMVPVIDQHQMPASVPGTIEAEDFDEGGQGVAYSDITAGNTGGQHRTTAVDIEATTDAGGGGKRLAEPGRELFGSRLGRAH